MGEEIPVGLLTEDAQLQPPPMPIPHIEIFPERLPDAWVGKATTATTISVALSKKQGRTLPWGVVRDAIDGALRARFLELTPDSAPWPCDLAVAHLVKLRLQAEPKTATVTAEEHPGVKPGVRVAEAELQSAQIQDLSDSIGEIQKAAAGHGIKFRMCIEVGGEKPPTELVVRDINKKLGEVSKDLLLK